MASHNKIEILSYTPEEELAFDEYEEYIELMEDEEDEDYLNTLYIDQIMNQ